MLAPAMVEEIEGLLGAGTLSQRKIAQRLGVSRGTVNAIALGKCPCRTDRQPVEDFGFSSGPPERCPGCGGMVHMPCLLCRIRAMREHRRYL